METASFLVLMTLVCFCAGDTATGDHSSDSSKFGKWRACMASKLPDNKKPIFDETFAKPGGTDMSKFRRGLSAVLTSYGFVNDHRVNLKKMEDAADNAGSAELKKAFVECPKDDKNAVEDRMIKCVIDRLEDQCSI